MVGRTFLAGAVSIEKGRLREAKRRPFLGLYVEGTNGDIYVREFSLSGLRLRKSAYHESRAVWFFNAELHDDDLPNASFDPLRKYLETVPSVPGAALLQLGMTGKKSSVGLRSYSTGAPRFRS